MLGSSKSGSVVQPHRRPAGTVACIDVRLMAGTQDDHFAPETLVPEFALRLALGREMGSHLYSLTFGRRTSARTILESSSDGQHLTD